MAIITADLVFIDTDVSFLDRTMFIWFPDKTPTAGSVKSRTNITQDIAQQVKNQVHIRWYFPTSIKGAIVFRPEIAITYRVRVCTGFGESVFNRE